MKSPLLLVVCLFLSTPVLGVEIHVPSEVESLAEALEMACAGDQVLLACGEYSLDERGLLLKDGVHLSGSTGKADCVVLLGSLSDGISAFDVSHGSIRGITFRDFGQGAMHLQGSFLIIQDCHFIENRFSDGGAIHMIDSSPQVLGCWFFGNRATHAGGAVALGASSPIFTDCHFEGNSAPFGGAMDVESHSRPSVLGGFFLNNRAELGGGALFVWGNGGPAALDITEATFEGNQALDGLIGFADGSCRLELESCIFVPDAVGALAGEGELVISGSTQEPSREP